MWVLLYQNDFGLINMSLNKLGLPFLINNWLGNPNTALYAVTLTNIWQGYPFATLMILAAIQNIDESIYEAAEVDGSSQWSVLTKITIPIIWPIILTVALLDFIWTFRYFDMVWIMTKGGQYIQVKFYLRWYLNSFLQI